MTHATIKLPTVVDIPNAQALKSELLTPFYYGDNVTVDASSVERIGTPGLQLLWSACVSFERAGQVFNVSDPSPAFLAAMEGAALTARNGFLSDTGLQ